MHASTIGSDNGHRGATFPRIEHSRSRSAWLSFVLAAVVVAAAATGLEFLVRTSDSPSKASTLARALSASANRQRALEEQAIGRGTLPAGLRAELDITRVDSETLLEQMRTTAGRANTIAADAGVALRAYQEALDGTLAALRSRGSDRAAYLDRTRVAPKWTNLDMALSTAEASFDRRADSGSRILLIAIPSVVVLLALFLIALVPRRDANSAERIRMEAERLNRDRAETARRELLARTVQAAEDERTRIAAELHDGPVQRLTAVDYLLQRVLGLLKRGEEDKAIEVSGRAQQTIREEIAGLRRVMSDLRPPVLDQRGLVEALREYAGRLHAAAGITCTVDSRLEDRLSPASETVLYRVAQEALQNVSKHSKASTARISLRQSQGWVRLEVQDDGVGYESLSGPDAEGRHFGMMGMKERVEMVGGRWDVFSRPGQGTRVAAILPKEPAR